MGKLKPKLCRMKRLDVSQNSRFSFDWKYILFRFLLNPFFSHFRDNTFSPYVKKHRFSLKNIKTGTKYHKTNSK